MANCPDYNRWHEFMLEKAAANPFRSSMARLFYVADALSGDNAPKKPGTMLDLGCGTGEISIAFAKLGFSVTGIDSSSVAHGTSLKLARCCPGRPRFIKGDMLEAQHLLPAGKWDFVAAFNVLHCLAKPEERAKFLAVVRTMLKPRTGRFYIATMCGLPGKAITRLTKINRRTRIGSGGARIHLEAETILAEINAAGLDILQRRLFSHAEPRNPGFETTDLSVLGTLNK